MTMLPREFSDLEPFETDYPDWSPRYGIEDILTQMHESQSAAEHHGSQTQPHKDIGALV